MPLYQLKCPSCGNTFDVFRSIAERDNLPTCSCSAVVQRVISAPAVRGDIESYISPATGRVVSGRKERREDLRSSNHIEWEPGIEKDVARNRQHQIEKSYKELDQTVDSVVAALNTTGKLDNLNA
jgi:putative FmdB family regulatory protein